MLILVWTLKIVKPEVRGNENGGGISINPARDWYHGWSIILLRQSNSIALKSRLRVKTRVLLGRSTLPFKLHPCTIDQRSKILFLFSSSVLIYAAVLLCRYFTSFIHQSIHALCISEVILAAASPAEALILILAVITRLGRLRGLTGATGGLALTAVGLTRPNRWGNPAYWTSGAYWLV